MLNDAKLFLYSGKGWKPLADLIESKNDSDLLSEITIYKLYGNPYPVPSDEDVSYAVVTISKKAEEVISEFGYDQDITDGNALCREFKMQKKTPVYGNNENAKHLACK